MENIRRSIKLFFTIYGSFLFQIIGIILLILFGIRSVNYIYKENREKDINQNITSNYQKLDKEELEAEKEEIEIISEFLDNCNNNKIEEAYNMLSETCINNYYQTIDIFKEYINKIFTHKKDYEIEKENDLYRITIIQGVLEAGSVENRDKEEFYYRIEENVLEKKIIIEQQ